LTILLKILQLGQFCLGKPTPMLRGLPPNRVGLRGRATLVPSDLKYLQTSPSGLVVVQTGTTPVSTSKLNYEKSTGDLLLQASEARVHQLPTPGSTPTKSLPWSGFTKV
jgi:hypothetical protein